jgi:hypothetical protein
MEQFIFSDLCLHGAGQSGEWDNRTGNPVLNAGLVNFTVVREKQSLCARARGYDGLSRPVVESIVRLPVFRYRSVFFAA